MAIDANIFAAEWLSAFRDALALNDSHAACQLFLPHGWLRDFLVFSWDLRTLAGHSNILPYLSQYLSVSSLIDVTLDQTSHLAPKEMSIPQLEITGVEFAFTFKCAHGLARAHARLVPDNEGAPKALTLMVGLRDLHGHEEPQASPLRDGGPSPAGSEAAEGLDTKPYVLVVGAGQTGLQVAACLKRLDVPVLVIERRARVGDNWRQRYPSLSLHTTNRQHTLLYQPYPPNWPEFTPGGVFGDWLEHYARIEGLVVWTKSELAPRPVYDHDRKGWDLTILREGRPVKLRPAHIVLATGTLGTPNIPRIPGAGGFQGTWLHSSEFHGGEPYTGKRVVVVGAGNSAIDIAQDLAEYGAASVTMIQRSPTCVLTREYVCDQLRVAFPDGVPLPVADLKWASIPIPLMKQLMIADKQVALDANRELHRKLQKGGVKLNMGSEGQGVYFLAQERLGGYWMDKGAADLIADGSIAVKSGVSPQSFTKHGLVMSDGAELIADAVVFATGYTKIRESNRELLGEDIMQRVDEVYGFDKEGEIKGSYRPCGHPGLWFATGDFFVSRLMSKPLALQIKAVQIGLLEHDGMRAQVVIPS